MQKVGLFVWEGHHLIEACRENIMLHDTILHFYYMLNVFAEVWNTQEKSESKNFQVI